MVTRIRQQDPGVAAVPRDKTRQHPPADQPTQAAAAWQELLLTQHSVAQNAPSVSATVPRT